MLASVFGHGCLTTIFVSISLVATCLPQKPVLDLNNSIEAFVVVKKSNAKMPERASKRPVPRGKAVTPNAAPSVKQSDLSLPNPNAKATEAGLPDRDADMEAVMRDLEMASLLDNLHAPDGAVDRDASSPDGTGDVSLNLNGSGPVGDPEYVAYVVRIQKIFTDNFSPLPTIRRQFPDLLTKVHIAVDSSGRVTKRSILESSGNPSFDASAMTAASMVSQIPLPPEKYRPMMKVGYTIEYK
jgi:TonB family protein